MIEPLKAEMLYTRCDPAQFSFKTTDQLEELPGVIGQARASAAIEFGVGIRREGYNLYVMGPAGVGRRMVLDGYLTQRAAAEAVPSDWCYINNFQQSHIPHALRLPAGKGRQLARDMEQLQEDLRGAIPAGFESDEYRSRRQELEEAIKEEQERAFDELRQQAEKHQIALIRTPGGMAFAPVRKGEVLSPEEFEHLSDEEKKRTEAVVSTLQEQLARIIHQIPHIRREGLRRIRELDRETTQYAVNSLIAELKKQYAEWPEVASYLDAVREAVIENADDFKRPEEGQELSFLGITLTRAGAAPSLRRYQVNVLVDNSETRGAPIVYEDSPSLHNLIGRVEHLPQMGALVTDFTLIKSGALHRANGGYLVLDVHKLLMQPYAWEGLKRALRAREVRIESLGQALSLISTVSLEPDPIPLDVKVVLFGERFLYYLLVAYDPEFAELFKVVADFEDTMDRLPDSNLLYARFMATAARQEQLLPLDPSAVARVIEQGAREADDAEKLSIHRRQLTDLLRESDYWARERQGAVITRADVQRTLDTRVQRADRVRSHLQEAIRRRTLLIDTDGERIGQVNGLSVVDLGQFAFGHPSRITARVRIGKGEVLDIQREVELGGPIHSKGVMILSGFLGSRYIPDRPLSLSASLVFEQTYGAVEGDSASCAELYALLSALAEMPIRQSLAVTGSVNQHGEVQAIGGVNEKIEGFFDICREKGLTGRQGVLIPASNVKHLMLRADIVEACGKGEFHVYPVTTIDEGIELLTGMSAGERDANGLFPDDTINQRVEIRLIQMAEQVRLFTATPAQEEES